jgi:peptide chain release factor 3
MRASEINRNRLKNKVIEHLALDSSDSLMYLAPTRVNLSFVQERYPDIIFSATKEQ